MIIFVCKRTGFVHHMLREFVKMTLTWVSSHWLWLELSRVILCKTWLESSWVTNFLKVTRVESESPKIVTRVESCYHLNAHLPIFVNHCVKYLNSRHGLCLEGCRSCLCQRLCVKAPVKQRFDWVRKKRTACSTVKGITSLIVEILSEASFGVAGWDEVKLKWWRCGARHCGGQVFEAMTCKRKRSLLRWLCLNEHK